LGALEIGTPILGRRYVYFKFKGAKEAKDQAKIHGALAALER
jgi:hypothetical protein